MADTATAPATDGVKRPEKPDEAQYKAGLADLEKIHKTNQADFVREFGFCPRFLLMLCRMPAAPSSIQQDLAKALRRTTNGCNS